MMLVEAMVMVALNSPPEFRIPRDQRAYTDCVAQRESEGKPSVVSHTGKYRGKYQFSPELAPEPRKYAARLRVTPMNRWHEHVQDAAFIHTLNHNGVKWSGMRHWSGGRWSCGKNGR
jgi:hypothetical protein